MCVEIVLFIIIIINIIDAADLCFKYSSTYIEVGKNAFVFCFKKREKIRESSAN